MTATTNGVADRYDFWNGNKALISNVNKEIAESSVTDVELGYLSGVTSAIQTQLNAKMSTASYPDLVAIEGLAGTSGLLRKTAANAWSLDTASYALSSAIPAASSTTPAALGTAAVGTGTTWARADHVHAMPTAAQVGAASSSHNHDATYLGISANAVSATKLATGRTITIGSTGKTFDGYSNVSWSLSEIGAPASANVNLGTTFEGSGDPFTNRSGYAVNGGVRSAYGIGPFANYNVWYNMVDVRHRNTLNSGDIYGGELVWGMSGFENRLAFRSRGADGTPTSWTEVWTKSNLTNLNQLTNGPGYITGNQTITLSGDASGSGTTSIAVTNSLINVTEHSTNNVNYPVVWDNTSRQLFHTASKLLFNPSTGTLTSTAFAGPLTGNASTATTWQTARTLTIGNTGKSVNGSANVSWSLAEIGAQAAGSYQGLNSNLTALSTGQTNGLVVFNGAAAGNYFNNVAAGDTILRWGSPYTESIHLGVMSTSGGLNKSSIRFSASSVELGYNTTITGNLTTTDYITTPNYVYSSLNSGTVANYVGNWGASGYYGFAGNGDTNTIIRAVTCSNTGVISGYAGISVDKIYTNNDGNGTNVQIGNDVWIGDINIANTMSIKGVANNGIGYIRFGTDSNGFGYNGSRLYYGGAAEIAGMTYASGGFTVPQAVNSYFGASQITRMSDYIGMWGFSATWQFGRGTTVYSSLHTVTATFNEGIDVLGTSYLATANVNNLVAPGLSMTPTSSSLVGDGYTTLNLQAGTTTLPTPTVGRILFLFAEQGPNGTLSITAPSGYDIHYRTSGTSTTVVAGGTSLAFNSSCGIAIGCPVFNSSPVWRLIW